MNPIYLDRQASKNSGNPYQTILYEQSDQALHCFPFQQFQNEFKLLRTIVICSPLTSSKDYFRNIISVKSLDPDQAGHFAWPDQFKLYAKVNDMQQKSTLAWKT